MQVAGDDLIESVVSLVAERSRRDLGAMDPTILAEMSAASRAADPAALRALINQLQDTGLSRIQLIDLYVPALARLLGENWCDDTVSFAEVTIATARLQALLAEFGRRDMPDIHAPQVAMLVRQDERHTLGAVVAANQLRRRGLGVHLILGCSDDEIGAVLRERRFEAVLLSASACDTLETVRHLVNLIRESVGTSIVLGGSILELGVDFRVMTGVDHATSDATEVLRLCGLKSGADGTQSDTMPD